MQATVKLHSLPFDSARTYLFATLFMLGNIIVPQMFHLVPQGGVTWLPIYFFTLVGAYKYGWRVGLLTALLSPVANSLLFGMPAVSALPSIMLKSALLAVTAGAVAARFHRATIAMLAVVVLGYQTLGTLGEWAMKGDFFMACQDLRIGIPGMVLQVIGGWLFINHIIRRG